MASPKARAWIFAAISMGIVTVLSPSGKAVAGSTAMLTGGQTSQPIGHFDFCKKMSRECSIRSRDHGPVRMTDNVRTLIATVNVTVNESIRPKSDFDIYGKDEVWVYPDHGIGDCEDYVLLKRKKLNEKGIALSNLLITVVRKPDGEGHAVLTVRTDQGDLILDNLDHRILPWEKTGYRFLKRQATNHTGRWVAIRDDQNMLVGSVR